MVRFEYATFYYFIDHQRDKRYTYINIDKSYKNYFMSASTWDTRTFHLPFFWLYFPLAEIERII